MANVQDVLSWYDRDLSRFSPKNSHMETMLHMVVSGSSEEGTRLRFRLYTETNVYHISASSNKNYLGCIAKSRKPRAGEDWNRGRDLADGPLSEETWRQILADIISFELVRIHRPPKETLSVAPGNV